MVYIAFEKNILKHTPMNNTYLLLSTTPGSKSKTEPKNCVSYLSKHVHHVAMLVRGKHIHRVVDSDNKSLAMK